MPDPFPVERFGKGSSYARCYRYLHIITPQAQREWGKVIGVGVLVYIYVCGSKQYLNRTLVNDSPFQTFAVGLLVEFMDWL